MVLSFIEVQAIVQWQWMSFAFFSTVEKRHEMRVNTIALRILIEVRPIKCDRNFGSARETGNVYATTRNKHEHIEPCRSRQGNDATYSATFWNNNRKNHAIEWQKETSRARESRGNLQRKSKRIHQGILQAINRGNRQCFTVARLLHDGHPLIDVSLLGNSLDETPKGIHYGPRFFANTLFAWISTTSPLSDLFAAFSFAFGYPANRHRFDSSWRCLPIRTLCKTVQMTKNKTKWLTRVVAVVKSNIAFYGSASKTHHKDTTCKTSSSQQCPSLVAYTVVEWRRVRRHCTVEDAWEWARRMVVLPLERIGFGRACISILQQKGCYWGRKVDYVWCQW